MHNPALVCQRWPQLVQVMAPVRRALVQTYKSNKDLQELPLAVGPRPARSPPGEEAIDEARKWLRRRSVYPWNRETTVAQQENGGDPDAHPPKWLSEGSPMAFEQPIEPGGLFLLCHSPAEATTLEGLLWTRGNHPSFSVPEEGGVQPPGLALLQGYYEKGYARRYTSRAVAEEAHGELVLAPMGTLTKTKSDGSKKHRVLQYLKRGGQNLLAELFERVVLPARRITHSIHSNGGWSWPKCYFPQDPKSGTS